MHAYDLIADWYASERSDQTGVAEVMALASSVPRSGRELDIACGNGVPITRAPLNAEYRVVGFDTSANMLARFRVTCPAALAIRGCVIACPLANGMFDAAVAFGVLFHLTQPEQVQAIANVSRVLKAGAPFLFTSGDADGQDPRVEMMNGVEFHYYSFTVEDYRRILDEHGFTLPSFHTDERGNSYYLAAKLHGAG